ncbi:MAG: hypothetical protein WCF90_06360 [Methanomicrobiales archaeon]
MCSRVHHPQAPGATTPAPSGSAAATGSQQSSAAPAAATKSSKIDIVINVHFSDIGGLDLQKELGVESFYHDPKYKITAASPNAAANVNVLCIDENEKLILGQTEPRGDPPRSPERTVDSCRLSSSMISPCRRERPSQ